MQIRMKHVRAANLCSRGAREWFRRYGLDYNVFLTEGYPESVILGTGDALGRIVVDTAHKMSAEEDDGEK